MILLEGKTLAQNILNNIKSNIISKNIKPRLEIFLIGNDIASQKYVSLKSKKSQEIGIEANINQFDQNVSQEEIISLINKYNLDPLVNGIMVQLPLPQNFNKFEILNSILPSKDVDGLTATSLGNLFQKNDCFVSATPLAVIKLLENYNIDINGKNAVILSRSSLIGLPLSALLINADATVTICHNKTPDIKEYTKKADIIISAISCSKLLTSDYIKDNSVLIDISANFDENNVLTGDFDFESVSQNAFAITPVPGGIGPITISCLLENTYKAFINQNKLK